MFRQFIKRRRALAETDTKNEDPENEGLNAVRPKFTPPASVTAGAPVSPTPSQEEVSTMSSEGLHAPRQRLSRETIHMHQAISSLMEELEAVDWYRQRADDCEDPALKAILIHNMREEIEHAAMALEWLRRNSEDFDKELSNYLFKEGPITKLEAEIMGREK